MFLFAQIPASALWVPPAIENFCWRIEQQVGEGGFALASGDPGTGKSAALRLLCERLSQLRDVTVGVLTRPQASLADFYRELGDLFQVPLSPHNRWASAKVLREKWHTHIETSLYRPVLLIDEAQEMSPAVLSELRLLSSADLDSRSILTVILAGDGRLTAKLDSPDLLPLASRIRSRLRTEALPPQQLLACLNHLFQMTGQTLRLAFDRERMWFELLRAGYTLADLRAVILYLQREIRAQRRNVGALKLSNLLQPDRFEEDLQISRVRLHPPTPPAPDPPPPLPLNPEQQQQGRQRALQCLRQIKAVLQ